MPLKLYRRHQQDCAGKHLQRSTSYESDEGRRGWKKCTCMIHVSGTIAGVKNRKSTGTFTWDAARAIALRLEKACWDGAPAPLPASVPEADVDPKRISIEYAANSYLAEHENTGSAHNTMRKYTVILKKLKDWAASNVYVRLDQSDTDGIRECRNSWDVNPRTAAKDHEHLKAFFEFCLENRWITYNPARFRTRRNRAINAPEDDSQKSPFTDDELRRMYDACENQYGKQPIHWNRKVHHRPAQNEIAAYKYSWTGQDLADFISVSVYTGMRISDVATFHIDRVNENGEVFIRATKNGAKIATWIPEWLQERIRERARQSGPWIFGTHTTRDMNVITDVVRRKLKRLWDLRGPWAEKPTPHRFRHTFVRILLEKG